MVTAGPCAVPLGFAVSSAFTPGGGAGHDGLPHHLSIEHDPLYAEHLVERLRSRFSEHARQHQGKFLHGNLADKEPLLAHGLTAQEF